jgi:hypothetical protein
MLDKMVSDPKQKMLAAEKSDRVIVMYPEMQEPFVVVELTRQPNAWHTECLTEKYLKQKVVHKKILLKNQFFRVDCEKFIGLAWYTIS